jgi:RNA polymerase sigma-70 factor (ECF subfamily)
MAETTARAESKQLEREAVFRRLVSRELAGAYRTSAVLLGDPSEAEDATQDALVRAWLRLDQVKDPDKLGAWFGRILVNVCRDRLRARRESPVSWIGADQPNDVGRILGEREALWLALTDLTVDQRIVVVLRYYLDLTLDDIAVRTGVPTGTVKSRLHHALIAVRAAYDAQDRAPEGSR